MELDLIVVGGGPGGYKAAITAAHAGARVALVERSRPGGTCLNEGCVPSGALLHLASLMEDVAELSGRGLEGTLRGDYASAMAHKDEVVSGIRDNFSVWLRRLGVRVLMGEARLAGGTSVRVSPANEPCAGGSGEAVRAPLDLAARRIVIAAGSRPRALVDCPRDGEAILDSSDFMYRLDRAPESVLVVGGGAIGVELGFFLHQFGSRVTLVEKEPRLLDKPEIPERAARLLERKLKRLGVDVRCGATVRSTRRNARGVEAELSDGSRLEVERVLVAVGRQPTPESLGAGQAGIALTPEGHVRVSEYLETSVPGVYAVGDVKPGPMTANAALHDAKVAATNALEGNRLRANYNGVPIVIHSALEIAAVGLTEERADAAGFEPDVARSTLAASCKARSRRDCEGFMEVVHDAETGQLLGGCIVGPEAGEQVHLLAAACHSPRGMWLLKDMSYSHPSWCEELESAVDPHAFRLMRSGREVFFPGILARHP